MAKKKTKRPPRPVGQCLHCHKSTDKARLPVGWHRDPAGNPHCGKCWSKAYVLRAVTIPVAGPMDSEWSELREAVKTCWRTATRLSNWATTACAKADITRTPEMKKLPKMPKPHDKGIYRLALNQGVDMGADSQSAASILRLAETRYRAKRYESVWLANTSLANYRYPMPYPCHNASWQAVMGDDGQAMVNLRLNGRRWLLRLRGGQEFRRQLAAHKQLAEGVAVRGELAILEQRGTKKGDNRPGMKGRDSGGQKKYGHLMVKMVGYFPRVPRRELLKGTLMVTTSPFSMIDAVDGKDNKLFTINGDHVRRWQVAHSAQLERWSEDSKLEERRRKAASFASRRERACLTFNRRMNTAADQIAAQVVNYAKRRRFAEVRWCPTDARMVKKFRWYRLATRMATLCNEYGIEFQNLAKEEKDEKDDQAAA